ncbi:MAG: hypothetical protein IPP46_13345 [Bacteroidetes bacterium]|nr:hypothetical protein [Bacteroidota bacterium]
MAVATGGIAPLQYSLNGTVFQASTSFTLVAAGTYPLTVRDANQCMRTLNVTVANQAGPNISTSSTLSSCFANDGTITATGAGGTGALQYSKNGVTYQSSPVFTNLAPGPYTITVKDTKNCLNTTNIIVGRVPGPIISVTSSPSICGDTIIVGQTGGMSVYQYNINNDPYQNSNEFPCKPGEHIWFALLMQMVAKTRDYYSSGNSLPIDLISFSGEALYNHNLLQGYSNRNQQ